MELLSYIGGGILCINMIPQIYKTWKEKSAKEISYVFLGLNMIGLSMMSVYGIEKRNDELYVPMIISLINTIILIGMKKKYTYVSSPTQGSEKETEEDNHQTEYSDNDVTNVHYHAND